MNTKGETNLDVLIRSMSPVLQAGKYVFVSVQKLDDIPRAKTICEFKEAEGTTLVLLQEDADELGLGYEYVAAWITLNVHSALEAVGLTAAFANALAKHKISCNVIAGYYHDHIFVDIRDGERALAVLEAMRE